MVAFDGTVLHGVIPGKGIVPSNNNHKHNNNRRVTLMLAFWKDIQLRNPNSNNHNDNDNNDNNDTTILQPGAARPWPTHTHSNTKALPSWAAKLNATNTTSMSSNEHHHNIITTTTSIQWQQPLHIGTVYEDLDGRPLSSSSSSKNKHKKQRNEMPDYEQVFQGF
jgi:hypothetical protein